jgi:hypothetical protein
MKRLTPSLRERIVALAQRHRRYGAVFQISSQLQKPWKMADVFPSRSWSNWIPARPGTSMGGARPKATIEHDGALWLAKFPERGDRFNLQRVEFATLDLARQCGLNTRQAGLQTVAGRDDLMLQRFDRKRTDDSYFRLGFVSALTVLDAGTR